MAKTDFINLGGLQSIKIQNPNNGSSVKVCLYGGTVYSFIGSDSKEKLFLSSKAVLDGSKPVRGGIPIVFPQFGSGTLPNHGFARISNWKYDESSLECNENNDEVSFMVFLESNEETKKYWEYEFRLELKVKFSGTELVTELKIINKDTKTFKFQALLHTYYCLNDIAKVSIIGLEDKSYIDKLKPIGEKLNTLKGQQIFDKDIDRIYKIQSESYSWTPIKINFGDNSSIEVVAKLFKNEEEQYCDTVGKPD